MTMLVNATTRQLIDAAQSGSSEAESALNQLLQSNSGLCAAVARKFSDDTDIPFDDLLQEARIAFVTAVHGYKPGIATFSTFVWGVMYRRLMKLQRVSARRNRDEVGGQFYSAAVSAATELADVYAMPFDERFAIRELVRTTLNEKDRTLLWRAFWKRESHAEIARRLGVTRAAIQKRESRALKTLRTALSP